MSKKIYQVNGSGKLSQEMGELVGQSLKEIRKNVRKSVEKEIVYHPKRLSPLDFIILKVLHGQFDKKSYPALPIALGVARKTLSQAKRLLSHGSL